MIHRAKIRSRFTTAALIRFSYRALLVLGSVMLAFGINVTVPLATGAAGNPADRGVWLVVAGSTCVIVGGLGSLFRGNGH